MNAIELVCLIFMPLAVAVTTRAMLASRRDLVEAKRALSAGRAGTDLNNVIVAYHEYRVDQILLFIEVLCCVGMAAQFHLGERWFSIDTLISFRNVMFCVICVVLAGMSLYNANARRRVDRFLREWAAQQKYMD